MGSTTNRFYPHTNDNTTKPKLKNKGRKAYLYLNFTHTPWSFSLVVYGSPCQTKQTSVVGNGRLGASTTIIGISILFDGLSCKIEGGCVFIYLEAT